MQEGHSLVVLLSGNGRWERQLFVIDALLIFKICLHDQILRINAPDTDLKMVQALLHRLTVEENIVVLQEHITQIDRAEVCLVRLEHAEVARALIAEHLARNQQLLLRYVHGIVLARFIEEVDVKVLIQV